MGYRDDFYIVENIVGYTGKLGKSPTVYFKKGDETGHITQYHELDSNVGREEVLSDPGYRYDGTMYDDINKKNVLYEEWPKYRIEHWSRNPLIPRDKIDKGDFSILCQAIYLFTEKKLYSMHNRILIKNLNYKEGESRVQSLVRKFSK